MTWGHVDADLVRLHDGVLDDASARRVREHLAQCAGCRELDDAIAFSTSALESLSPVEARESDREKARAAMLRAVAKAPAERGAPRVFAWAAAVVILIAGIAWWYRPRVRFVAAPLQRRSIETFAFATGQTVASIAEARRMVAAHTGVTPNLQPTTASRILIGTGSTTIGSAPASTIIYQIDAQPVFLIVARAAALPDPPPSLLGSKRLELRHNGEARVFTWSASGDAYSLRVPNGVPVARACAICHEGTRMMPVIERSTRGM